MTIPLKQWVHEEARQEGVSPSCIYVRFWRGKYKWLPLVRKNKRVVLVDTDAMTDFMGLGAYTEGK